MLALVTTIKHGASNQYYAMQYSPETRCMRVSSMSALRLGEHVKVDKQGNAELAKGPEDAEKARAAARVAATAYAESATKKSPYKTNIEQFDEIAQTMWHQIADAARLLLLKVQYAAPIIIRYHNDIDGASGAYAIYSALKKFACSNIIWEMHKGIAYGAADAQSDIAVAGLYESLEKPLLLIIDFGTTEESNAGIKELGSKTDLIWLDHHPVTDGFSFKGARHYINPWLAGGDSNFTAGSLATLFAHAFSDIDATHIMQASFIGDYSKYAKPDKYSRELAAVLDVATSDTQIVGSHNGNLTPEAIEGVLEDEKKRAEVVNYANNRMEEVLDTALESVKVHRLGGVSAYVLDFEKARGTGEKYPLPGRFASRLMGKIEELDRGNAVLILHMGLYVSIRESTNAKQKLNLLKLIDSVKKRLGSEIDSGGGHMSAGSIRLSGEYAKKAVINALLDELGKELGGTDAKAKQQKS
ncbi:MAG: DHH family phosphoesterase [Candidatus Micrarchaeaceae archaeon]